MYANNNLLPACGIGTLQGAPVISLRDLRLRICNLNFKLVVGFENFVCLLREEFARL